MQIFPLQVKVSVTFTNPSFNAIASVKILNIDPGSNPNWPIPKFTLAFDSSFWTIALILPVFASNKTTPTLSKLLNESSFKTSLILSDIELSIVSLIFLLFTPEFVSLVL